MNMQIKPAIAHTKEEMKKGNPFATHEIFLTKEQINEFEKLLIKKASETTIDTFLAANPEIFTGALHNFRTGHHAAIVVPKQEIKPRLKLDNSKGLIPDFIIGGKSSDGWNYWIVELKGSDQTIFSQTNFDTYFSPEINKGICQLLEYTDFCSEQQAALRDQFKLEGFREPNGLLIAGRENEILNDSKKQKLKAAWNKLSTGKLEIRTYDFIMRHLRGLFDFHEKQKAK
ncbi:MAG TPA: DUF4263 domain-containing protein [Ferruginibacter sp.]|nr:DUF4263 domain-containing protein [Ferruginibacter sp.]